MSLTEISYYTRKLAPLLVVGGIFFLIFFFILKAVLTSLNTAPAAQPQTQGPDACFGKLIPLVPDINIDYPTSANFTLDNIEGKPLAASASAQVFFLSKNLTRFGYASKITLMAKNVGFDTEITPFTIDGDRATFDDGFATLHVDIADFNFDYTSDYRSNPDVFTGVTLPSEQQIVETGKQFLRTMGTYPEELSRGKDHVVYLNYDISTDTFTPVETADDANAVEIDFFRPDIGSYPVVSPSYFNSQNYVIVVFKEGRSKVIKAQTHFFERKDTEGCAYPIKSGQQAWDELVQGQGIIASAGSGTTDIVIKKMFLGYYEPIAYQKYLQPVYVFLSNEGFVAYVPAVVDGYIDTSSPDTTL